MLHKKIKTEHHILSEFHKILKKIADIPNIKKIIPGRISRKQKGSSHTKMTLSYATDTGRKYIIKKGATAQEIFVITKKDKKEQIKEKIEKVLKGEQLDQ